MTQIRERELTPRAVERRAAMVEAARAAFLHDGYLGTNMDEIAAAAGVSKQTLYKHFGSKEALFIAVVTEMTLRAGDGVHETPPAVRSATELEAYLAEYAFRQLAAVLTPEVIQIRRLVIGEAGRFPALARAMYEHGPQRALTAIASHLAHVAADGILDIDDTDRAAEQFNWLVMSGPVNRAMLLGDTAIEGSSELRRHAEECAHLFVAAYRAGGASHSGRDIDR